MKRVAATAAIALLALLAVGGVAVASHQDRDPGKSPRDFAVGGGRTGDDDGPFGETTVGFSAHGGPSQPVGDPEDPVSGHFTSRGEFLVDTPQQTTAFTLEGPVTCLVVTKEDEDTTSARLFYPVKQSNPDQNEVTGVLIALEDNGNPRDGDPRDKIGFALVPDEDPDRPEEQDTACLAPLPATDELEEGNFTLHDADPGDTP